MEGKDEEDIPLFMEKRRVTKMRQKIEPMGSKTTKKNPGSQRTMYGSICALSDDLSNLLGTRYMRRSDVVKSMWNYFKYDFNFLCGLVIIHLIGITI